MVGLSTMWLVLVFPLLRLGNGKSLGREKREKVGPHQSGLKVQFQEILSICGFHTLTDFLQGQYCFLGDCMFLLLFAACALHLLRPETITFSLTISVGLVGIWVRRD